MTELALTLTIAFVILGLTSPLWARLTAGHGTRDVVCLTAAGALVTGLLVFALIAQVAVLVAVIAWAILVFQVALCLKSRGHLGKLTQTQRTAAVNADVATTRVR